MRYTKTLTAILSLTFFISCSSSDSPIAEDDCDGNCGTIVANENQEFIDNPQSCPNYPDYTHNNWGTGGSTPHCLHLRIENECSGEIASFVYYPRPNRFVNKGTGDRVCDYQ